MQAILIFSSCKRSVIEFFLLMKPLQFNDRVSRSRRIDGGLGEACGGFAIEGFCGGFDLDEICGGFDLDEYCGGFVLEEA